MTNFRVESAIPTKTVPRYGVYQEVLARLLKLEEGQVLALDLNPDTETERCRWRNGVQYAARKLGLKIGSSRPRKGVLHLWLEQ